jgi:hypothetical protein
MKGNGPGSKMMQGCLVWGDIFQYFFKKPVSVLAAVEMFLVFLDDLIIASDWR